jgi:hypothetical protein
MTLSRSTVQGVAALCGGIPDITFTVSTTSGGDLWVAEHPDAQLCVHAFRTAILEWPQGECHEPTIEAVEFDDFDEIGGVLAREGERWFVSPLCAKATAGALNAMDSLDESVDVVVREDLDFGVSVVRVSRADRDESLLDHAALAAYAACLIEDLIRGSVSA